MTAPYPPRPTYDPLDYGNRPGDGPLRVGGVAPSQPIERENNLPSTLSPAAKKQVASLTLVRDLWGGTERLRDQTTVYLPQAPGEDPANYRSRVMRSVFFNVFRHTVVGLIGFVFRRDPVLGDDVPAVMQEHAENIDLAGTHFDVFCRDLMTDAETTGHAAILVDYPDTGGVKLSLAEEKPLRPYWVPIRKENILSWRTTVENGRTLLRQLVLKECQYVEDGAFGQVEQVRYRVLYRDASGPVPVVGFRLLAITDDKRVYEVGAGLYGNQTEIPVAEIPSSGREALFESKPPLLDLAFLNVAHYQQWSDYAVSLHKTCVPIFTMIGMEAAVDANGAQITGVVLGPNSVLNLPVGGKAEYVSHSGQALGACKNALDDLIRDMAALGLAALASQKRAAETAASKQIDKDATDSALSVTARGLQDGLERALSFHANYLKLPSGGSVVVNRDFEDMTMRPEMLVAYVAAVSQAGLPVRILLEAMQQGGLIGPDEDLEALEAQMAAEQQAIDDQKAQAAKDALALKQAGGGAGGSAGGSPGDAAAGAAGGGQAPAIAA